MKFFCITESWLAETNNALRTSCGARGIEYVQLDPFDFDYVSSPRPVAGDLMYRPGAHISCRRLEHLLYESGIVTLSRDPFFDCFNQLELLEKFGLPVLKTVTTIKPKLPRELLLSHVDYLGGLPLVLKLPGSEGGVGIIKVDTLEGLFSLIDYLQYAPLLMEYFEHIVSYRVVVLNGEAIAVEARHSGADDFRTNSAGGGSLGKVDAPENVLTTAIRAADILQSEFGGIDIIQSDNGEIRFCEMNYPCYFADQQKEGDIDISGKMIDYLMLKSSRVNT